MQIIDNIPVFGDPIDEGALRQIRKAKENAAYAALMADHHLGYGVPIGGVVAYRDAISPTGVGYDIACGNKAVRLDLRAHDIRDHMTEIMNDIVDQIAFGVGRKNNERVDHPLFDDAAWSLPAVAPLKEMARQQLGTVGSGNHYVDVFAGDDGYVWIGVHFGSRGLGHKIATYFLKAGGAQDSIDAEPLVLKVGTPLADDYLACMELAGKYAYAGRDWVCAKVSTVIGAQIAEEVHNHHNFAWQEEHFGEKLWVVRKGATPAFPGQLSFVGGSMGDSSYILRGKDSGLSKAAMYSTVHGAGRVMSRTAARGKFNRKTGERKTEGAISRESMQDWLREKGVVLRGADVDEAPQAYKRIDEVLAHHADTVEIVHKLTPLGVAMAGSEIVDPYKD